jgi:hypothetical protein
MNVVTYYVHATLDAPQLLILSYVSICWTFNLTTLDALVNLNCLKQHLDVVKTFFGKRITAAAARHVFSLP